MADEQKLRLILPTAGHLTDPNHWNVYDVLSKAKIGERIKESDKHIRFRLYMDGLEIKLKRPRDIPRAIFDGRKYGRPDICGVTGRDLTLEAGLEINQSCDLECSYVDLVFATKQELWEEAQECIATRDWTERARKDALSEKNTKRRIWNGGRKGSVFIGSVLEPTDLDAFLYFMHNKKNKGRKVESAPIVCGTEYPKLAEKLWGFCPAGLRPGSEAGYHRAIKLLGPALRIKKSGGVTEDLLDEGADLILENMATGESLITRGCVPIQIAFHSTARLYVSKGCGHRKFGELSDKIDAVVKDIGKHCQIRFVINLPKESPSHFCQELEERIRANSSSSETSSAHFYQQERRKRKSLDFVEDMTVSSPIKPIIIRPRREEGVGEGYLDWIVDKQSLPKIIGPYLKPNIPFEKIICMDLKYLLGYCRIIEPKSKKYPVTDLSELRPEHYKEGLIFSKDRNGIYINHRYKGILDGSSIS